MEQAVLPVHSAVMITVDTFCAQENRMLATLLQLVAADEKEGTTSHSMGTCPKATWRTQSPIVL